MMTSFSKTPPIRSFFLSCLQSVAIVALSCGLIGCSGGSDVFRSSWPTDTTRAWIGPEYWANTLADWRLDDGRLECLSNGETLRTVHLLTRVLGTDAGDLEMSVRTGLIPGDGEVAGEAFSGFLIGAGPASMDYRGRAIVFGNSGENGGLIVAVDGDGQLAVLDNADNLRRLPARLEGSGLDVRSAGEDVELRVRLQPAGEGYQLRAEMLDAASGQTLQTADVEGLPAEPLSGNLALVSHPGSSQTAPSFWFRDWRVEGDKVTVQDEAGFGPVFGTLYTVSRGQLKLTAQMAPVGDDDPQDVVLELQDSASSAWQEVARASMVVPGYTATFVLPEWDSDRPHRYRVAYPVHRADGVENTYYEGLIQQEPKDRDTLVAAAFTGNLNLFATLGAGRQADFNDSVIFFPHNDVISAVKKHNPDFLIYTGDQIYEHRPQNPDRSGGPGSFLDYYYKWGMFLWAHGALTRNTPAITVPDDHDVFHINLWGAGGRPSRPVPDEYPPEYRRRQNFWPFDVGYLLPPEWVNMVERTQTSHLPDPFDPRPVQQGIGVYFTDLLYAGVSFAILEDRKFKASPVVVIPEAKSANGFPSVAGFEGKRLDVSDASLLGERQLNFLRQWAADWQGVDMKVAVSQTILATVTTRGGSRQFPAPGENPPGRSMSVDMDSNGWPQSGRNRALRELRRGFAFMIAGDQHLGTIVHHGIDEFEDAGYSFCVPAIANVAPRSWHPSEPGENQQPGMPHYTGRFFDGFGNRVTVWAASNPRQSGREPASLHNRATGYGIVRFDKREQTITMEAWPRYSDPDDPQAVQFPGWPKTISLEENYNREARAYLPELTVAGVDRPVVQVVDESTGEIVYTVRAKGNVYRPKVFREGTYTIHVGEPGTARTRTLSGIRSLPAGESAGIAVDLSDSGG